MPRTLPLLAAQPNLPEIVAGMVPGEELVLTSDGEPVTIVTRPPRTSWPCQPGTARDRSFWMAPDFDAPMDDFAEVFGSGEPERASSGHRNAAAGC